VPEQPAVTLGVVDSWASVTLAAEGLQATFLPGLGMVATSLQFEGDEYLSFGGTEGYAQGHTTGIPILHPWANRLRSTTYKAAGASVDLSHSQAWHPDGNGLPIHGVLTAESGWQVLRVAADAKAAAVVARFDFADRDDLMTAFPFAHVVEVEARVERILPAPRGRSGLPRARLVIATTVRATGRRRVPVAFGWHPYLRLPGMKRADTRLVLPGRDHLVLDEQQLPTGASNREAAEHDPLGKRTFDDAYRLGRDRRLALEGGGRRLTVEFDRNYPWAQVYAPVPTSPSNWFVCLEPMTAPVGALSTDETPFVAPGGQFTARFSVSIGGGPS